MDRSSIPPNPIEKERIAIARNVLADVQDAFKLHRETCRLCTEITPVSARWCPEGWEMVKEIRKGIATLTELIMRPEPQADTLF